jgi:hypothetical protein
MRTFLARASARSSASDGDRRAGEDVLDLAVDAVVRERPDEQLRVLVERVLVDLQLHVGGGTDEEVDRRKPKRRGRADQTEQRSRGRHGLFLLEGRRRVDDGGLFRRLARPPRFVGDIGRTR